MKEMRKNFVPKYRYYTNGENVVVAVASYKGRTIRGVAKWSEQDEFDLETGKKLAAARCAMKIAKERVKYTKVQRDMWQNILAHNAAQYEMWEDRYDDALEIEKQAREAYEEMIEGL